MFVKSVNNQLITQSPELWVWFVLFREREKKLSKDTSKNIKVKKKKKTQSQPRDSGLLGTPYYIRLVY